MKCYSRKYVLRSFCCTSQPFCSLQVITKSVLYPRFVKKVNQPVNFKWISRFAPSLNGFSYIEYSVFIPSHDRHNRALFFFSYERMVFFKFFFFSWVGRGGFETNWLICEWNANNYFKKINAERGLLWLSVMRESWPEWHCVKRLGPSFGNIFIVIK